MKITRPAVVTDYDIAPSGPLEYMDVMGVLEKYGMDISPNKETGTYWLHKERSEIDPTVGEVTRHISQIKNQIKDNSP
jgi:hypothetical protein